MIKSKNEGPFIKWVGGKRSILPELIKRLPRNYKTYYELFLGGGALFFAVKNNDSFCQIQIYILSSLT